MASSDQLPWCAANKCPAQDCTRFIDSNYLNQTAQSFVACCRIKCGSHELLLPLKCGGATSASAIVNIVYLLVLLFVGLLVVSSLRIAMHFTYFVLGFGSLVFTTGTGAFVANATSSVRVLQSAPALGAMNVAVFSYFYSGFQYGVGLIYEGGPLIVFVSTAYSIGNAIHDSTPGDGPLRQANWLAFAMLVMTCIWIIHSINYRLYGYRVEWRLPRGDKQSLNPNFHLGAAQGHPTWRTPMGQSTSVVMTLLAWLVVSNVKKDLDLQRCRARWFFHTLLYGAPILITFTIIKNVFSATRCRNVRNLTTSAPRPPPSDRPWYLWFNRPRKLEQERVEDRTADYPGLAPYKHFKDLCRSTSGHGYLSGRITGVVRICQVMATHYIQAAALERMGRNTLHAEVVPNERLEMRDKIIGVVACILASLGLIMSIPAFFALWLMAYVFGFLFEAVGLSKFVETEETQDDRHSAARAVEMCYVGQDLNQETADWQAMSEVLRNKGNWRSINLHTLLDNTGPSELYSVLHQTDQAG